MASAETQTSILDKDTVQRKLKRMALQIAEQNTGESEVVIAGIVGNGTVVARRVGEELKKIVPLRVRYVTIQLDKKDPFDVVVEPATDFNGKMVIIADDVANTGKTMFYALKPFLQSHPRKLQTLVLVERSHKLFPIQTDYAGLTLATTLQEHIVVETAEEEISGAWLY